MVVVSANATGVETILPRPTTALAKNAQERLALGETDM
ncbi:hypothetical protein RA11412_0842 [Rothia aeria]|uniref:Uncharacterized protein n=1 Tax=Rothia aeria TaxID=172042 RepID=A0A2Z5QXP6_9MICC|nr:hypothetical protein RA11412_0842 [Rothia aeria]